jgi:hypothetical protein
MGGLLKGLTEVLLAQYHCPMFRLRTLDQLALAEGFRQRAQARVDRQREAVAKLKNTKTDFREERELLARLEAFLALNTADVERLTKRLDQDAPQWEKWARN